MRKSQNESKMPFLLASLTYCVSEVMSVRLMLLSSCVDDVCVLYVFNMCVRRCGNVVNDECADK